MRVLSASLLSLAPLIAQDPDPARELDATTASLLRAAVLPTAAEPWQTIAWRTDLAAARDEAERSGRPLFLWTMNGHPLGCT